MRNESAERERPFRHYSIRNRVVAFISQRFFDHFSYTVRHGLIRGMKRKGGLGWLPQFLARYTETPEDKFWKSLDLRGLVVYDVGAFQGLLTLFFARTCKQVICYEPNPKNYGRLLENIRLNRLTNVTVRKFGLGADTRPATLVFSPLMSGGSSLDTNIIEDMKNLNMPLATEQIQITTLDRDISEAGLLHPGFIKVDVEGLELEVLQGARNALAAYRPRLFLEMHGATMDEKKRKVSQIVAWLEEAGYDRIMHVESGNAVSLSNSCIAAQGHLYCVHSASPSPKQTSSSA